MPRTIPESDWKLFRKIQPVALERYCERVLGDIKLLASGDAASAHERYLAVYKHIHDKDRELGMAFDDMRRSTALVQLAVLKQLELLTPEKYEQFSTETREVIALFNR